jgi:hypothetical protein
MGGGKSRGLAQDRAAAPRVLAHGRVWRRQECLVGLDDALPARQPRWPQLCKWNDEDRSDPRRVLRALAFLLAIRLPDHRRRLLDGSACTIPMATSWITGAPRQYSTAC